MAARAISVLVLYRHSLLGLGLAELLSREGALDVVAVDESDEAALDAALAREIDVIVFEEGGAIEPLELLRRTRCPLVIDVNIGSSDAWSIRRDTIRTTPERLLDVIREATARAATARAGDEHPPSNHGEAHAALPAGS
jgi:DNA-binding NarL/FixJ family response regulator